MIYDLVGSKEPIRQGDVFMSLPRVRVSLSDVVVYKGSEDPEVAPWEDLLDSGADPSVEVYAVLPLKPVNAIVVTQDCDAVRRENLSLSEIVPLVQVLPESRNWSSPKTWVKNLTRQSSESLRYFYLPPGGSSGFTERMGVDFRTIFQLPRVEVDTFKYKFRRCRLNRVAYEHFRETLAQFFRRYPYNPWYPLNRAEFEAYASEQSEAVEPYAWQK